MGKLKIILLLSFLVFGGCSQKEKTQQGFQKKNIESNQIKLNVPKLKSFLFVGIINNKPGIYKYDILRKNYSELWSNRREKVVDLTYSKDRKTAFFLTATRFGKRGVFPYINNIKLYLVNIDSSKVVLLKKIGSGMQVFTEWSTDNTYKVMLNSIDKTIADYVHQNTQIFNTFGKELLDETKTYNIIKEGYPQPPKVKESLTSPDEKYFFSSSGRDTISIYLNQTGTDKKFFIIKGIQKLNQLDWVGNDKYVIFSTINIMPGNNTLYNKEPQTSKLIIYSIKNKKIIKKWDGGGIKNFFIVGNILVFDTGFGKNSIINIYNINKQAMMDSIKIRGGCGIKNIPQIPDYSA